VVINVHKPNGLMRHLVPAKGEVGNVNPSIAEDGSNAADDAGNVLVSDVKKDTVQRSLNIDSV